MMKPWQHLCDQKGEECLLKYLSVNLIKDVKDLQSVQPLSHVQLFVTPWTACSTPSFLVHQLPKLAQIPVLWVGDSIQPSHPLSSPSPPACNVSQHQGLFKGVSFLHQVVKVLEFQLQHQSFQWTFRTDFLYDALVGSPCSPRDSQESFPHHSSKASILQPSSWSNFHIHTWLLEKS